MKPTNDARFIVDGFSYNPVTGTILKNGVRRDFPTDTDYRSVRHDGIQVRAHRLAWRLHYGEWPQFEVDHRNLDKADNVITNLRPATRSQNVALCGAKSNCKSGERGVFWCKTWRKWKVRVSRDGRYITSYASHKISAILAARLIRRVLHGEFAP